MAKSGGRLATTARLFVCTLLIAGAAAGRARAQRLELRAGAVISSALVEDAIAAGASTVRATARPAPLLGTTVLLPLRPPFSLEAGAAYAFSSLRAMDSSGSWNGQGLGVLQALIGIRYRLGARVAADSSAGPYLRGAVGAVRYSTPTRSVLEAGVPIEPAIELGAGWRRAIRSWAAGAELGAQIHGFAPESLRRAGGSAGGVKRGFLLLTLSRRLAR